MSPETEDERAVARIHECLNEVYMPKGVTFWLMSMNRNLGMRRPVDLMSSGQYLAVLAEAERLSAGAW